MTMFLWLIVACIATYFFEKAYNKYKWNDGICRNCKSTLVLNDDIKNVYKCTCCARKIRL